MTTDGLLLIIAIAVVGAVACAWQLRRALREPLERDQPVAEGRRRIGAAVLETEPGIDLAHQDECELLWDMPAYIGRAPADDELAAGFDRLRAAIRDEQRNGDA